MPAPRPGDRLTVTVTGLDPQTGLGRAEAPLAVSDGLPGEAGEAVLTRPGRHPVARLVARTGASPDRAEPPCPRWTPESPCRVMHLAPAAQGALKRQRLVDALAAAGVAAAVAETVTAPRGLGWRARATYVVARDKAGRLVLGAYRRGTHRVQPMAGACPLEEAALAEVGAALQAALAEVGVEVADPGLPVVPDDGCGAPRDEAALLAELARGRPPARTPRLRPNGVRYAVLRAGRQGEVVAALLTPSGRLPGTDSVLKAVQARTGRLAGLWVGRSGAGDALFAPEPLTPVGEARPLAETLGGLTFRVGPQAFFQVNREAAEVLHQLAVDAALPGPAVDVYAGVGAMTLRLARRGEAVVGIESNPQAVAEAIESAEANGLADRVEMRAQDAAEGLHALADAGAAPVTVVLNPPRKGCAPPVLDGVTRLAPGRVVYVSCGPESLGRDLAVLVERGYRVVSVTPVDLFPQSEHVEAVAVVDGPSGR